MFLHSEDRVHGRWLQYLAHCPINDARNALAFG